MKNILLLSIIFISITFLGFRDTPNQKYKTIYKNIILREDGALYIKGKINLKLKNPVALKNTSEFGIASLDNTLRSYLVNKVIQRYPLKADVSKRMIGDEDIAKIYTFFYDGNIDPTDLSELIKESNGSIIEWVEPDFVYMPDFIPNDPNIGQQYHISKISAYQAWDLCKGDTNVIIGIVDSGSDLDHPDLAANISYNWDDPPGNNVDDDNNGYIDDFKGWDFFYNDNDPNIAPSGNTHGSHVSGDASQVTNNNVHGGGIGYKVKLRISKHTDDVDPQSYLYNTNDGIVYCYQNGCKVINCSFGSSSPSSYTQTIVDAAWANGTIICASAGNEGANILRYPAAYNHVVCVASSNSNDIKSSFSNYHDTVDVTAPGESILSTVYKNLYDYFSGTSMSSPITAGTVALIKSKYPAWNPAQIVDRLKLGVDSIYNLNPGYVGKLGTGRINAFKCVSDKPIIAVTSYSHNDSLYGNNDKVYDVNEKVSLMLNYKNVWLAGSNISLRLTTTDPDVEITKDSVFVGNLAAFTTYSTSISNTFEVRAKSTCPFDKQVTFKLGYSNTAYSYDAGSTAIVVTFRQGWATHNVNNLKLSLTKDGAVGKKSEPYGSGLFIGSGNTNQIYEGGLMIGASNTKVSDDCRRGTTGNYSDTDFTAINSYIMQTPGVLSNQDGNGLFNDNGAGTNKIGVEVKASSYAFTSSGNENFIILKYRIKNTSGANLTNIHAGIYMFFKPNGSNTGNISKYDSNNKFGYTYNQANPDPYLGISLLSNNTVKFAGLQGLNVLNGFTTEEKWNALSTGILDTITVPGINCFVISTGPLSINNNDSAIVGFAVLKGSNLADLQSTAINAKNKWNSLIGIQKITGNIPAKFELFQNYPNPFNPSTKIKFSLPKNDQVTIKVYDIIGREVEAILNNKKMEAGTYEIDFNNNELSSGIYFYRIETNYYNEVKKMVLLK